MTMKINFRLGLALFAALFLSACQTSPTSLSDETVQDARAEFERQKAEQIHLEYWQAQMERDQAMQDARERARERAEQRRRSMD